MKGLHSEIDLLVTVPLPALDCKPIPDTDTSVSSVQGGYTDRMLCRTMCTAGTKQHLHVMLTQSTNMV